MSKLQNRQGLRPRRSSG